MSGKKPLSIGENGRGALLGHYLAVLGFLLFAAFAPHSIAGAEISIAIVGGGWLIRTIASRRTGFQHSKLDLPIGLFLLWTFASALFSAEPRISIAKLQSVTVFFLFYLTQAIVTRRTAVILVAVMILSGVAGTFCSVYDLVRGRGEIIESVAADSPFRQIQTGSVDLSGPSFLPAVVQIEKGDTVWRVAGHRVYSVADIDNVIKQAGPREQLSVSVITHGEHAEWTGFVVTERIREQVSPSGLTGAGRLHRL